MCVLQMAHSATHVEPYEESWKSNAFPQILWNLIAMASKLIISDGFQPKSDGRLQHLV